MAARSQVVTVLRGIAGGAIGAVLGYHAFFWIADQGFYAMILPGALLGLGCGLASGGRSLLCGVLAAISALALGVYTEWQFAPFARDSSLAFFLAHVHELTPITIIMILLGGVFGYWFGVGREPARSTSPAPSAKESTKLADSADPGTSGEKS